MIILFARFQQTSNAEYYSKRNFVKIVHASINLHTERQGFIKYSRIFKEPETGPQQHVTNMEAVAEELQVIQNASFGGHQIQCVRRGVREDQPFLFVDENILRKCLSLSEQRQMVIA